MFILSYFRKKQNIKVKENTLEHLDDDFIVISDTLSSTSIEEDKKEENVKNIDIVDQLKINNNSIEYLNQENDEVNYDISFSGSHHKSLKSNPQDKSLKSDPQDRRDEENDILSFSASRQGSLFETSSSLWSQRRDEENQLIENKKDNHKKLSFCDKIMKELVIFIFGEDVIRKNKLAQQN